MVDLNTMQVRTLAGDGSYDSRDGFGEAAALAPKKMAFDRSPHPETNPHVDGSGSGPVTEESAVWITSNKSVVRYHFPTDTVTTLKLIGLPLVNNSLRQAFEPYAICCLQTGLLLVSCNETHTLLLIDPKDGHVQPVVGGIDRSHGHQFEDGVGASGKFYYCYDCVLIDSERCLYFTDFENCRIRRVSLPDSLFL